MAETDPKEKEFVTRRLLNLVVRDIGRQVKAEVADPMEARLDALEKRIAALEDKPS